MAGPTLGSRRESAGHRANATAGFLTFAPMDGMPRPPDPDPDPDPPSGGGGRRAKPAPGRRGRAGPGTGEPRQKRIVANKPGRPGRDRPRGKASAALKAMRERVARTEGFPFLSQRQMAAECGIRSTSTYQYYEDDYADDYFTLTLVQQLMPPLVARGIPEDDVKICLLGDVSFAVASPSDQAVRRVPVFARTAVGLVARGDIDITSISKSSPADLQRWEAAGVITGHEWLPGVTDTMLVFDLGDGTAAGPGTLVTVDTAARDPVPGKSYVYSPGPGHEEFVFATLADDGMVVARGPGAGSPVRFDPRRDYLVGQVVLFIERM